MNEITKKVLLGVSTLLGFVVADGIYKAATRAIDNRVLIGDGEVISDEVVEETE